MLTSYSRDIQRWNSRRAEGLLRALPPPVKVLYTVTDQVVNKIDKATISGVILVRP